MLDGIDLDGAADMQAFLHGVDEYPPVGQHHHTRQGVSQLRVLQVIAALRLQWHFEPQRLEQSAGPGTGVCRHGGLVGIQMRLAVGAKKMFAPHTARDAPVKLDRVVQEPMQRLGDVRTTPGIASGATEPADRAPELP